MSLLRILYAPAHRRPSAAQVSPSWQGLKVCDSKQKKRSTQMTPETVESSRAVGMRTDVEKPIALFGKLQALAPVHILKKCKVMAVLVAFVVCFMSPVPPSIISASIGLSNTVWTSQFFSMKCALRDMPCRSASHQCTSPLPHRCEMKSYPSPTNLNESIPMRAPQAYSDRSRARCWRRCCRCRPFVPRFCGPRHPHAAHEQAEHAGR